MHEVARKFRKVLFCNTFQLYNFLIGTLITTVFASDRDDPSTPNGTFSFTLDSVSPKTDNIEFYISQIETKGNIYFKGCLDYQVNIIQYSVI